MEPEEPSTQDALAAESEISEIERMDRGELLGGRSWARDGAQPPPFRADEDWPEEMEFSDPTE